eukprot:INCI16312.10.p1 GENE.INCI16312.10~~INCI16312.10.p1  ORF type:complete len:863 (+),score=133.62 INCI16312.10:242-2590(+)
MEELVRKMCRESKQSQQHQRLKKKAQEELERSARVLQQWIHQHARHSPQRRNAAGNALSVTPRVSSSDGHSEVLPSPSQTIEQSLSFLTIGVELPSTRQLRGRQHLEAQLEEKTVQESLKGVVLNESAARGIAKCQLRVKEKQGRRRMLRLLEFDHWLSDCKHERNVLTAINGTFVAVLAVFTLVVCLLLSAAFTEKQCFLWAVAVGKSVLMQLLVTHPLIGFIVNLLRLAFSMVLLRVKTRGQALRKKVELAGRAAALATRHAHLDKELQQIEAAEKAAQAAGISCAEESAHKIEILARLHRLEKSEAQLLQEQREWTLQADRLDPTGFGSRFLSQRPRIQRAPALEKAVHTFDIQRYHEQAPERASLRVAPHRADAADSNIGQDHCQKTDVKATSSLAARPRRRVVGNISMQVPSAAASKVSALQGSAQNSDAQARSSDAAGDVHRKRHGHHRGRHRHHHSTSHHRGSDDEHQHEHTHKHKHRHKHRHGHGHGHRPEHRRDHKHSLDKHSHSGGDTLPAAHHESRDCAGEDHSPHGACLVDGIGDSKLTITSSANIVPGGEVPRVRGGPSRRSRVHPEPCLESQGQAVHRVLSGTLTGEHQTKELQPKMRTSRVSPEMEMSVLEDQVSKISLGPSRRRSVKRRRRIRKNLAVHTARTAEAIVIHDPNTNFSFGTARGRTRVHPEPAAVEMTSLTPMRSVASPNSTLHESAGIAADLAHGQQRENDAEIFGLGLSGEDVYESASPVLLSLHQHRRLSRDTAATHNSGEAPSDPAFPVDVFE